MTVVRPAGSSLPPLVPEQRALSDFGEFAVPSFYLTGRQAMSPAAVLLAIVGAVGVLSLVIFGLSRGGAAALGRHSDPDDPDQVDVIVIGDSSPAHGHAAAGDHVSTVHPTILVHLPRFGDQSGLIPNSPAGHLLYDWLAAFNHASYPALANALPNADNASVTAAQMQLRRRTGGLSLLSAKEVEPGILIFRLRDQTPSATEVLGTLQVGAQPGPASIASFSLLATTLPPQETKGGEKIVQDKARRPGR